MSHLNYNISLKKSLTGFFMVLMLIALGGFPGFAGATGQGATDLFDDAFDVGQLNRSKNVSHDSTIMRTRMVRINSSLLLVSNVLDFNLFGDVSYRAFKKRSAVNKRGNIEWIGSIRGEPLGQVTMVFNPQEEILIADISVPGASYQVLYAGNGLHKVRQLNLSKFSRPGQDEQLSHSNSIGPEFERGDQHTVTWDEGNLSGDYVKIELYDQIELRRTLIASTDNSGEYTWTIPDNQGSGIDLYAKIISISEPSESEIFTFFTVLRQEVIYPSVSVT